MLNKIIAGSAIATVVVGGIVAMPGMATAATVFFITMLTPAIAWFM